ncbi:MAG TPA: hypothetical protein VHO50_09770, partial [Bacteroidales bacterium]|nr:hypothetical protein [Bacteroidales bacterium]
MKRLLIILLLIDSISSAFAQEKGLSAIDERDLRMYMNFFASDDLKGREAGTQSNDAAALYIMSNLIRLGIKTIPQSGTYYQEIPVQKTATKNSITIENGDETYNDSLFLLLPTFQSMKTESQVVFAGFGHIDEETGYNEIESIDMKDKIVIVMTGTPGSVNNGKDKIEIFSDAEGLKLSNILLEGARVILMVYNPSSSYVDPYMSGLASVTGTADFTEEGGPVNGLPLQI